MTGPDDPSVQTPTPLSSPAASNRHGRRNGNPNHLPFPLVNTQHGASVHQRDLGLLQLPASVAPIAAIAPSDQRGGTGGGEEGSLSIYRFMRQPDQPSLVGASSTGHVKLFPRCGMDDNTAWMHGAVRHGGRLDQQVVVVVGMALFFARVVMRERVPVRRSRRDSHRCGDVSSSIKSFRGHPLHASQYAKEPKFERQKSLGGELFIQ